MTADANRLRGTLVIRRAVLGDVEGIVRMLADDPLGSTRERVTADGIDDAYVRAFAAIDGDPHQELVVGEIDGALAATLHLTVLPSLTYRGRPRGQIEAVRVRGDHRRDGVGRKMFQWAIGRAAELGCHMLQLTTDRARPEAAAFYEELGFVSSHLGMKLKLGS